MTDNSDQPVPGADQQPNATEAAAAAQAVQQQAAEPEAVDIDAKEVAEAIAAAEAEKAATGEGGGQQVDPGQAQGQQQQPPAEPQGQQTSQPQGGDQVMIPKPRLDQVLSERDAAKQDAAFWRGVAEARNAQQGQPQAGQQQQPQPQGPTAEQRLATIHADQDALAKKFDDGEITMADMRRQERDLNSKEAAIREEVLIGKVQPQTKPPANDQMPDNSLYLDTLTAQLENEHPWVGVFDKVGTEVDWKYLKDRAIENLVARGIDPTNGTIGRFNLRKEVAELADQLGPGMISAKAKAKGIALPGQQQPQSQQGGQAPLSPQAQARARKLDLAENAPPNLRGMSGSAQDSTPSDSRIEQMSDDEIGAMPDATRKKYLGIM